MARTVTAEFEQTLCPGGPGPTRLAGQLVLDDFAAGTTPVGLAPLTHERRAEIEYLHAFERAEVVVRPRHMTKTDLAAQLVRERIRTGELEPGRRLGIEELTRDLGMSPTPIREALRLLQADGLVSYRPHHGMVVADASSDRILEIYRLRQVLEPMATELAVQRFDTAALVRLEKIHREFCTDGGLSSEVNGTWHWAIYDAAGSELLSDFIRRLWDAFPWRAAHVRSDHVAEWIDEHERVMEAIRAGDGNLARVRMTEHIARANKMFLDELPSS